MKVQHTATLDFTDNGVFETGWRIKQGDYGNTELVLRLVNNGVNVYDAGIAPQIAFRRWDGASVISVMTPNDQTYKYAFAGNELEVPGLTLCDVKFTDAEGRVSTASCRFTVVEDTIGYDPTGAHTYDNPVSELVEQATNAAEVGIESSFKAEGFAVGEQGGVPVEEGSPYYHNNAKYYAQQAGDSIGTAVEEQTTTTGQFTTKTGGKLESCIVAFNPVQSGSGDPSPSNVRPITGHSSVEVRNHKKNYINQSNASNIVIPNGNTRNGFHLNLRSGTYTVSLGSTSEFKFYGRYKGKSEDTFHNADAEPGSSSRFTLTEDGEIYLYVASGKLFSELVNPMLEEGSTATAYEPYQGQDVTVALGGTYYGGTLDVVSGKLTIDKANVDLGSLNWLRDTTGAFYVSVSDKKPGSLYVKTETYKTLSTSFYLAQYDTYPDGVIGGNEGSTNIYVYVKDTRYSDATSFKTAVTGYKLVYELATPIVIQLTPQQINTLIGENNIDVPLTGQSLTSAVYREMFTWSDILDAINAAVNA